MEVNEASGHILFRVRLDLRDSMNALETDEVDVFLLLFLLVLEQQYRFEDALHEVHSSHTKQFRSCTARCITGKFWNVALFDALESNQAASCE